MANVKRFATSIVWDVEDVSFVFEDENVELNLPTRVEIPSDISDDYDITDYLSDEYGFLVWCYDVEEITEE